MLIKALWKTTHNSFKLCWLEFSWVNGLPTSDSVKIIPTSSHRTAYNWPWKHKFSRWDFVPVLSTCWVTCVTFLSGLEAAILIIYFQSRQHSQWISWVQNSETFPTVYCITCYIIHSLRQKSVEGMVPNPPPLIIHVTSLRIRRVKYNSSAFSTTKPV